MTKQELATKIWETANALRKNIKASEYKDYIIGFMFYNSSLQLFEQINIA